MRGRGRRWARRILGRLRHHRGRSHHPVDPDRGLSAESCTIGGCASSRSTSMGSGRPPDGAWRAWLIEAQPDVLCLQEVRADDVELGKVLADAGLAHWSVAHTEG